MSNSSIRPINRTLSGVTTPSQSGPGSNGNEGVLHIPQSSSIIGTLPSDCLVSYPGHLLREGSYPTAKMQLVCFTAPADWAVSTELNHLSKIIDLKNIYHFRYNMNLRIKSNEYLTLVMLTKFFIIHILSIK